MTAIEEMYKAYGVESGYFYCGLSRDRGFLTCKYPRKELYEDCSFALCDKCEYKRKSFHPFTAEKQLEIVQYIGLERGFKIVPNEAMDYILMDDVYADDKLNKEGYGYGFEQALVDLLLKLKDYLDHAKVKEILE